ncbi:MAG: hypothetical protein ACJ76B_08260 [Solirubrobacterales bacterium]
MVGPTVRPAFAARVLGVSPPALRRWMAKGEIATVFDLDGSRAIPLSTLIELKEAVDGERRAGRRHVLEGAVDATRRKAERLPRNLAAPREQPRGQQPSDLRGLAYHRAVARRLDRPTADMALALVRHWRDKGSIDPRYAEAWEGLLQGPLPGVRRILEDESERARDLRQNSPFAGVLSEAERRAIADQVR